MQEKKGYRLEDFESLAEIEDLIIYLVQYRASMRKAMTEIENSLFYFPDNAEDIQEIHAELVVSYEEATMVFHKVRDTYALALDISSIVDSAFGES